MYVHVKTKYQKKGANFTTDLCDFVSFQLNQSLYSVMISLIVEITSFSCSANTRPHLSSYNKDRTEQRATRHKRCNFVSSRERHMQQILVKFHPHVNVVSSRDHIRNISVYLCRFHLLNSIVIWH
jgi:hypothetical protein